MEKKTMSAYRAGKGGMTLVEVLLVLAIMTVLASVLFGAIRGGLNIWERAVSVEKDEDIRILLDKISEDVRRAAYFSEIKFKGNATGMSFAIIAGGNVRLPGGGFSGKMLDELKWVEYRFNALGGDITRGETDYAGFREDKLIRSRRLMRHVHKMRLRYFMRSRGNKLSSAKDSVNSNSIPRFIRLEITYGGDVKRKKLTELIEVPIAGKLIF